MKKELILKLFFLKKMVYLLFKRIKSHNKMKVNKELIDFLEELKENNYKEWFDLNRNRYEQAKKDFLEFVNVLIHRISEFDSSVSYLKPKDCIFRINRDVRFAKDKSPYKTNFGTYIVKGGKKSGNAGYYLHIEPNNCFIAGGIYEPSPNDLKAIRTEIYENPQTFKSYIENTDFVSAFGGLSGDKLTNLPRGYDKSFEFGDLLKYKNFISFKQLTNNEVLSDNFLEKLANYFNATALFNGYLNEIVAK